MKDFISSLYILPSTHNIPHLITSFNFVKCRKQARRTQLFPLTVFPTASPLSPALVFTSHLLNMNSSTSHSILSGGPILIDPHFGFSCCMILTPWTPWIAPAMERQRRYCVASSMSSVPSCYLCEYLNHMYLQSYIAFLMAP